MDRLMQKFTIMCSSGFPQISVISGDWQFEHISSFILIMCGIFLGPSPLSASPPHFLSPPFFFLEDSSVKEVSCHRLGMWILTVPVYMLFDVFPRLTSHQIPGLGVWAPLRPLPLPTHRHTQRPVRWICLVSFIWRVGGACSFLVSLWAVKIARIWL